jgi:hypothetical protein
MESVRVILLGSLSCWRICVLSNLKLNNLFLKLGTQEDRAIEIESVFTSLIEKNKSKVN